MNQNLQSSNVPLDDERRRFLCLSLLSLCGGSALLGCTETYQTRDRSTSGAWWLPLTGERNAVMRLGQAYLREHPEEKDLKRLQTAIETATAEAGDVDPASTPLATRIAALQRAVRLDFERGTVTSVDRWLLSRTEAQMYAAASLLFAATSD